MLLFPDGKWEDTIIGADLENGQRPQSVIPAGTWQAAGLLDRSPESWGLFGAAVFPGFEYKDFMEGEGSVLAKEFPSAAKRMDELGIL